MTITCSSSLDEEIMITGSSSTAWGSLSGMTTATSGLGGAGSGGRYSGFPLLGLIAFLRVTVLRK